jgi:hypothetical protein
MIKTLTEKRSKLLVDARTLMTGETVTAETRAKADAMIAEAEVVRGDIERIKATEVEPEQRSRKTPPVATSSREAKLLTSALSSSATSSPTSPFARTCAARSSSSVTLPSPPTVA